MLLNHLLPSLNIPVGVTIDPDTHDMVVRFSTMPDVERFIVYRQELALLAVTLDCSHVLVMLEHQRIDFFCPRIVLHNTAASFWRLYG
jgi:hypothetical protein